VVGGGTCCQLGGKWRGHAGCARGPRARGGPAWSDDQIADALEVSRSTVERLRTRCVEEGPDAALRPRPSPTPPLRKLDGAQEARLIAVACSPPPEGRKRWTLRLLADKVVELDIVDAASYETVRRTLKKTSSSPG
jgi:transposase